MATNRRFAEQLRRARKAHEFEHGDITQEQIGERVAEWLGDPQPYSAALVSKWFGGGGDPSFSVGVALFSILGADLAEAAKGSYVRREPAVTKRRGKRAQSDVVRTSGSRKDRGGEPGRRRTG